MACDLHFDVSRLVRQVGEDNDIDNYLDSSSDASSDYEFEKHLRVEKEQGILHHLSRDIITRMGSLSIHGEHPVLQEGFSSDDGEAGNSRGVLLFEFLEQDAPYGREPLADKASLFSYCCRFRYFVVFALN